VRNESLLLSSRDAAQRSVVAAVDAPRDASATSAVAAALTAQRPAAAATPTAMTMTK